VPEPLEVATLKARVAALEDEVAGLEAEQAALADRELAARQEKDRATCAAGQLWEKWWQSPLMPIVFGVAALAGWKLAVASLEVEDFLHFAERVSLMLLAVPLVVNGARALRGLARRRK
jgi:uncharacterized small protein (DUF1192 family)